MNIIANYDKRIKQIHDDKEELEETLNYIKQENELYKKKNIELQNESTMISKKLKNNNF